MRARSIKPGFFKNEDLAELPFATRILFTGLWCMADREGRMEDRPKRIKADVFPYDDVDVNAALNDLEKAGFITRYSHGETSYIQVLAFAKHQNPHCREGASTIPAPASTVQGTALAVSSPADSGLLTPDSGLLTPEERAPVGASEFDGVDPQVVKDFRALRTKLRAPITSTAMAGIRREAEQAGLTLESALRICCERGWRGFKAEWLKPKGREPPVTSAAADFRGKTYAGTPVDQLPAHLRPDADDE